MDGKIGSEDEFHETLEDITSASSSEAEEGGRRAMRAGIAGVAPATSRERPPVWTPSSFHSKFSVWKNDPSSITDRRQRLFQNWGIKNLREDPSTGSTSSLANKSLLTSGADKETSARETLAEKRADSNTVENGFAIDSGNKRLEENSGAVLREGNSKLGPVLSRLGPVSAVTFREGSNGSTFRSSGNSPDVSPYPECHTKLMASPEGSLSPLWDGCANTEAGHLYQASSSQEKLSHSYDTDNGYETRSQDGYSAAEDYNIDDLLKIKDLDSGKEFLINRFSTDGSLHMLREVDTGRELTLAEFEKVVGLSPITQEMMRRQQAAESGSSNEKQGSGKTSGKKKNGWLKYFVVKRSTKEKPVIGGSTRSDKQSLSGEDTDGSTKGGRLSPIGSSKGGNSREGSFADPDRDVSTKGELPSDDTAGPTWRQPQKVKVKLRRKSVKELSGLYMGQEIQAHQGAIWTMKFSTDGRYLASAGQDRVIQVWEVVDHPSVLESDISGGQENGDFDNGVHLQVNGGSVKNGSVKVGQHYSSKADKEGSTKGGKIENTEVEKDGNTKFSKDSSTRSAKEGSTKGGKIEHTEVDKDGNTKFLKECSTRGAKEGSTKGVKSPWQDLKLGHPHKGHLPKLFWLSEKPVCSFHGHTGDILDLSWSQSKLLLSSSMDKTVRLWHISEEDCLRVFCHNDYVTCVQFNPVDDSYFLSGSLDYKLRTWSIPGHQVVDWIDLREMITAVSYVPDGEKAIVGSHKGTCRFYNTKGNKLQLDASFDVRTENKKGRGKKITGLHCMPGDPQKVLVTSNDSRIRVYDGMGLCAKYKGLKNINSQISASYTRNGDYIISASEDSRVLIWSSDNKDPSSAKSLYGRDKQLACEEFSCRFVSLAIPWPGTRNYSSFSQPDIGTPAGSDSNGDARAASEAEFSSPPNCADLEQSDDKFDCSDRFLSCRDPSDRFLSFRDQVDVDEDSDSIDQVDSARFENQGSLSGDGENFFPQPQSCRSFFDSIGPNGSTTRCSGEQPPASGSPLSSGFGMMRSASLGSDDGRRIVEDTAPAEDTPAVSALWGLVIVTAGLDGKVRTFQNYGHPVRL